MIVPGERQSVVSFCRRFHSLLKDVLGSSIIWMWRYYFKITKKNNSNALDLDTNEDMQVQFRFIALSLLTFGSFFGEHSKTPHSILQTARACLLVICILTKKLHTARHHHPSWYLCWWNVFWFWLVPSLLKPQNLITRSANRIDRMTAFP